MAKILAKDVLSYFRTALGEQFVMMDFIPPVQELFARCSASGMTYLVSSVVMGVDHGRTGDSFCNIWSAEDTDFDVPSPDVIHKFYEYDILIV